jgi:hypothetical protein
MIISLLDPVTENLTSSVNPVDRTRFWRLCMVYDEFLG